MRRMTVLTLSAALAIPAVAAAQTPAPPAPQTFTLSGNMVRSYQAVQRNITEAAEKMPEAGYAFKPTPEVRPFGELIAHVAFSQFGTCAALKGDAAPPHKGEKEDAARSKTELIALFKESTAYCDPAMTALKDEDMTTLVKAGQNQVAKGLFLHGTNTHGNEMYGTMAVYLRLKGIVPPTTERQNAAKKSQ
ncbi:MAG TPA: DinB family protein [Vicinamibacterales bacterium]